MIFRRRDKSDDSIQQAIEKAAGKPVDEPGEPSGGPDPQDPGSPRVRSTPDNDDDAALASVRSRGPWDADEVDIDEDDPSHIDLGGLIVKGIAGLELQLQTDEQSGQIVSIMFVTEESGLELRAFASSRGKGLWDDVRRELGAEATRMGGTATKVEGPYGDELRVMLPVQTPDGQSATQPSRVVGIEGPRWLLRATFLGKAALEPDDDGLLEAALRDVVVVRGSQAMPPREQIPLRLPPGAEALTHTEPEDG
ncbi:MAG: DUF3710 domain-containing protein [Nocardioidaceae bacterium]